MYQHGSGTLWRMAAFNAMSAHEHVGYMKGSVAFALSTLVRTTRSF